MPGHFLKFLVKTALQHQVKNDSLVLHAYLKEGRYAEFLNTLNQLKAEGEVKLNQYLFASDQNGKNILHYAAQYGTSPILQSILNCLGEKVHQLAVTPDNDGYIPLLLAKQNRTADAHQIKKTFKQITIDYTHEDINSPVLIDSVLTQYPHISESNSELLKNLEWGCIAASHVRAYIKKSVTHTNNNLLDKKIFAGLFDSCEAMRREANQLSQGVYANEDLRTIHQYECKEALVKKYGMSTCQEYAELTFLALIKMGLNEKIDIYGIGGTGDHAFVVLGRKPSTNEGDFRSWGENCVIVDAWKGKVYPAQDIPHQLQNYLCYRGKNDTRRANIVTLWNEQTYKGFVRYKSLSDDFYPQEKALDANYFNPSEIEQIQNVEKSTERYQDGLNVLKPISLGFCK